MKPSALLYSFNCIIDSTNHRLVPIVVVRTLVVAHLYSLKIDARKERYDQIVFRDCVPDARLIVVAFFNLGE